MTELNYVHFITFLLIGFVSLFGIYSSLKQKSPKLRYSMLFSVTLVSLFLAVLSLFIVDKYTKKAQIVKIKNKRILGLEKIIYSGVVKNSGHFKIGKIILEIKLVNKGHATGNIKGGNFYKSTGLFEFLNGGMGIDKDKPQTIVKRFIIAKNLKPGYSKQFRVFFRFPPYFSNTADFIKLEAH